MEKNKVIHLSHTNIKYDSRILKQMKCLKVAGYEVSGIGVEMSEGVSDSNLSKNIDIKLISLKSRSLIYLPRLIVHVLTVFEITCKMLMDVISAKPNIIHCHDTIVLPLGVVAKFFGESKIIYDAHELESDRNGLSKIFGKLTLFAEKILWSRVDYLITVSSSIDLWYQRQIGYKKSEVILNSPILSFSEISPNNYLREKFSIPIGQKIFIYVGILSSGRGIECIIEAFKKYSGQASVVFLGYGKLQPELELLAEDYESIYFHNAVKHEQVVSIVKSADVGLCFIENISLSDYYCLPNKLFEYCFSGLPVLASNLPEIKALIQQYYVGATCDFNELAISKQIDRFVSGEIVVKYNVDSLYPLSWQAQEEKLVSLYKSINV